MIPQVRPAVRDDAEAIARIHVLSWQTAYRGQLPDHVLDDLSVERRRVMWQALLEQAASDEEHLGVVCLERVVGFAHVCHSRDNDAGPRTAEVSSIYLAPAAWGIGAGRMLMSSMIEWLAGAGYTDSVLWVLDSNERARRFYEAAGWAADGAEKSETIAGVPVTEVRYRRDLPGS
jgi:GNAT superfamily N-acetyltransferase